MISVNPSLYLKPEAYKTDVLYLQLPETSIGNMTFARTSVATRLDKNGLVEELATGIPRLDYTNGSCPELLLERERTNLCLRSEEIENGIWNDNAQMTVTANTSVSPDGTKTADRVDYVDNGSSGLISQNITVVDSTNHELSIYMKGKVGGEKVKIDFRNSASVGTEGTEVTLTAKWVRYTESLISTATDRGMQIKCLSGDGSRTFYVWGSQLESGDYGTSYIKTTSASVSRAIESCHSGGDSTTFNSIEGVLYCEIKTFKDETQQRNIGMSDSTSSNAVLIRYDNTLNRIIGIVRVGSVNNPNFLFVHSDVSITHKIALKYKVNDFALWVNGVEVLTDNSGSVFSADTLTEFALDDGGGGNRMKGNIKDIRVYKTALTDAELTELTTL